MTGKRYSTCPGKLFIVSLGCPKNLVDTEVMTGILLTSGWQLTMDEDEATTYLINTCAFIPPAREEVAEILTEAEAWKQQNPKERKIAVSGCLVQWQHVEQFRNKFKSVDLWLGIDEIPHIAELLGQLVQNKTPNQHIVYNQDPQFIYDHELPRLKLTLPHIGYLKVGDGCNNRCSYCAIPNIRGDLRSRPIDSIIKEAQDLLAGGTKELLVMAQDTTAFGMDNSRQESFAKLLSELDQLDGEYWLRVLYTHPAHFNDAAIETFCNCKHLLPYIDIPLQHISNGILQRMGRIISGNQTRERLQAIRKAIPEMAVRTTFITGFPGETEADFNELKDFAAEQKFERLGVFAFSPEPGTPASEFSDQVPTEIAIERADAIMDQQEKISLNNNQKLVGKDFDVIVDFVQGEQAVGRTYMDAPEIDNIVQISNSGQLNPGDICQVKITNAAPYELEAIIKK